MQPYELPDFHVPHPARLNPRLEAARQHAKAWAYEMGMTDVPQGADDCALLTAWTHPDAPGPELEVLADWYVWAFHFGDRFLELYKRTGDLEGAKEHLAGLPAFMPVHPGDAPPPEPENPVERGLADLWSRTAPSMSARWRERFADRTARLLDESLRELSNITEARVPDPVHHIERRRKAGGAPWSAALVEYSLGIEIPPEVADARPLRVLLDAFSDGVQLRNDLFSCQRETQEEGGFNNGVLVLERFFERLGLESGPQRAADVVGDLLTSRLRRFEDTALTELPPLFEEYDLGPMARDQVLRYVKGLRDWQSGGHEWHAGAHHRHMSQGVRNGAVRRSRGGPAGLGMAAAQVGLTYGTLPRGSSGRPPAPLGGAGTVAPTARPRLPEQSTPHGARVNPHLDGAREHASSWARDTGMLDAPRGPRSPAVWNEAGFEAADYALFAALTHPDVPAPELDLVSDWHLWGFYFGDFFVKAFERPRDLAGARAFLERLPSFMPASGTVTAVPAHPVERGLADLWSRTAPALAEEQRRRIPEYVQDFTGSRLRELAHRVRNRMPDPVDHVGTRRGTAGTGLSLALVRHTLAAEVPPEVLDSAPVEELTAAFSDVGPLRNDLRSYHRDIEDEGEPANAVLVVQRFLGCGPQEAAEVVNGLAETRMEQFERVAAVTLPAFLDAYGISDAARDGVTGYVRGLRQWMAGDQQWAAMTGRYHSSEERPSGAGGSQAAAVPRRPLGSPSGLGTSAARLASPRVPAR